jgi:putative FmdB family regulatory protein
MPTYEYHCSKCEKQFEVVQSIKDKPLTTCPKSACRQKTWGKGKVKKLIGAGAGLIFKGSGFYITDYRSEKYKEAAKKESSNAKPAGDTKSTPAKTETKTASSDSGKKT